MDDIPTNLEVLFDCLTHAGFKILVAEDGESALQKARYALPDLILLDILMPGIDGFETCYRLKSEATTNPIPIIFMTALTETVDKVKGFSLGAVDYITKPLQHEEVLARIQTHLQLRHLTQQLQQQNDRLEQEIQERQRIEEERIQLLAQEQQARAEAEAARNWSISILESITDGFFALDHNWCCTYLNPQAEPLLQRSKAELLNKNFWEVFPEAVNSSFYREYHRAMAEQISIEFEEFYPPSGRWFAIHAYPAQTGLSVYFQDITARKQSELALRQSEERFQLIAKATNDAIWDWNLVTDQVWWSEGIETLFGYSIGEVGRDVTWWYEHIHPGDRSRVTSSMYAAIQTGQISWTDEYRYQRADGSFADVIDRAHIIHDKQGRPIQMVGGMTDITERKQLENMLRNTAEGVSAATGDEFLRSLVHYLAQILNADYAFVSQLVSNIPSPTARTLAVYGKGEAMDNFEYELKDTPCEIVLQQGLCCYDKGVQQLFPHDPWLVLLNVEGYIGMPLLNATGQVLGLLVVLSCQPLHQPKMAEAMLQIFATRALAELERTQAEQKLQLQHRRSQLFAEVTLKIRQSLQLEDILQTAVTEVQQILQADRVLIYRLWADGTGSGVAEAVLPELSSVLDHQFSEEVFPKNYQQLYQQGRVRVVADVEAVDEAVSPCLVDFVRQFQVRAKLVVPILIKEHLWGLLIAHQCKSARQWTGFETNLLQQLADQIGIALTQSQLLEQEIRQRQELARSNSELQQFAYIASHDLQEPLRMISSYLQLLERRYKDRLDGDANDFIAYAVDGANRMKILIDDLLVYSRVGTRGKAFEVTDCTKLMQQAIANLQIAIEEKQAIITWDALPEVLVDPIQLTQLFQNLIGNAIKFHNLDRPTVHITAQRQAEQWLFSVQDNGIGIDPQYAERIFVIFQRLHNRTEYAGTGIGLAICKKIVERHNGQIWVDSQPGNGSTFCFTIPERDKRSSQL
ncbi:MAG: GAF domain-containing protein [Oculatellaceae cyanobacterium bins.114]|nr:GAF domain-containing protein [Oculatellaceae cyanobacterium bins.114]